MNKKPNCMNCEYFFITYDMMAPRGCKLYQIKSKDFPNVIVKASSGLQCQGYKEKKKKEEKNLNDPKLW